MAPPGRQSARRVIKVALPGQKEGEQGEQQQAGSSSRDAGAAAPATPAATIQVPPSRSTRVQIDLSIKPPSESSQEMIIEVMPTSDGSDEEKSHTPEEVFEQSQNDIVEVWGAKHNGVFVFSGTGFVVGGDGPEIFVMTCAHVVIQFSMYQVKVHTPAGQVEERPAHMVMMAGHDQDLSILRVENAPPGIHKLRTGKLRQTKVGARVILIGYTGGELAITDGILGSKSKQINAASRGVVSGCAEHTAEGGCGSSGGPLFNCRGEVVGVNAAARVEWVKAAGGNGQVVTTQRGEAMGVLVPSKSFAIPIEKGMAILGKAMRASATGATP